MYHRSIWHRPNWEKRVQGHWYNIVGAHTKKLKFFRGLYGANWNMLKNFLESCSLLYFSLILFFKNSKYIRDLSNLRSSWSCYTLRGASSFAWQPRCSLRENEPRSYMHDVWISKLIVIRTLRIVAQRLHGVLGFSNPHSQMFKYRRCHTILILHQMGQAPCC